MENVLNEGFCEMSEEKMLDVDGGSLAYDIGYGIGAAIHDAISLLL